MEQRIEQTQKRYYPFLKALFAWLEEIEVPVNSKKFCILKAFWFGNRELREIANDFKLDPDTIRQNSKKLGLQIILFLQENFRKYKLYEESYNHISFLEYKDKESNARILLLENKLSDLGIELPESKKILNEELFNINLKDSGLSDYALTRISEYDYNGKIKNLGQLALESRKEMSKIRSIGAKTLDEIKALLATHGVQQLS